VKDNDALKYCRKKASYSNKKDPDMARRSKAVKLRIGNFSQPPKTQKARSDDITESDSESEDEDYHPEGLKIYRSGGTRLFFFENY
jgi:hypothetical protein